MSAHIKAFNPTAEQNSATIFLQQRNPAAFYTNARSVQASAFFLGDALKSVWSTNWNTI